MGDRTVPPLLAWARVGEGLRTGTVSLSSNRRLLRAGAGSFPHTGGFSGAGWSILSQFLLWDPAWRSLPQCILGIQGQKLLLT